QYRLYTVYHLKKLKVLDGIGISAAEVTKAKDEYSGKMTSELLLQKVGHMNFKQVTYLDLSNVGLKEFEGISAFPRLQDLSLENNNLSNLKGIEHCSALVTLNLANNKLE